MPTDPRRVARTGAAPRTPRRAEADRGDRRCGSGAVITRARGGGGEGCCRVRHSAETLARYAASLKYEDMPEEWCASPSAPSSTPSAAPSAATARVRARSRSSSRATSAPSSRATVLISGIRTSPDLAVFANGVMIRYLDFNDAFVSLTHGAGHPSDTIAALLPPAEIAGRSGRDLITATVLAYEVFCKIADVFDYLGNGIDHSTITGMARRGRRRPADGTDAGRRWCRRSASPSAATPRRARAAPTRCRTGRRLPRPMPAARRCFRSSWRGSGMTGPGKVFEGTLRLLQGDGQASRSRRLQLGEPFGIRRAFTKRFPLGQFSQTVAQAAVEARRLRSRAPTISPRSTSTSRIPRSRSWPTGPTSGGRRRTRPPITAFPMPAGLVLMYGKIDARILRGSLSARFAPARPGRPHQGACRRRRPTAPRTSSICANWKSCSNRARARRSASNIIAAISRIR